MQPGRSDPNALLVEPGDEALDRLVGEFGGEHRAAPQNLVDGLRLVAGDGGDLQHRAAGVRQARDRRPAIATLAIPISIRFGTGQFWWGRGVDTKISVPFDTSTDT